jgi:hypothetical protein
VHRIGVATARPVALGRDGVEVAGEQHERALAAGGDAGEDAGVARIADVHAAVAQHAEHVRSERRLVARLRRDVDELQRAGGEAVGEGHDGAGYPARPAERLGREPPSQLLPGRPRCWR